MSIPAAVITKMVELGLQARDIMELCQVIEESMAEQAPAVDLVAEKRRAYDRERKRAKLNSTGNSAESSTGNSTGIPPEITPLTRVRDITPTTEISGSVVVVDVSASERATDDWPKGDVVRVLIETVGSPRLDPSKSPGLVTTAGRLAAWRRDGASWQFDVLPVIQAGVRKTGPPIGTWKYFDAAVAQSVADNRQALTIPQPTRRQDGSPQRPQVSKQADNMARAFAGAELASEYLAQRR